MAILRVQSVWSGWSGAPGYTNFHFSGTIGSVDAASSFAAVSEFWETVAGSLAPGLSIRVSPTVEMLDDQTGELIEYEDVEDSATWGSAGSSTGWSAATGAVINWMTNTVSAGRRVRGRTFLVPLSGNSYDDAGTLTPTVLGRIRGAASDLIAADGAQELVVFSRPRAGGTGVAAPVTSARVPDMAAVLRSRRD